MGMGLKNHKDRREDMSLRLPLSFRLVVTLGSYTIKSPINSVYKITPANNADPGKKAGQNGRECKGLSFVSLKKNQLKAIKIIILVTLEIHLIRFGFCWILSSPPPPKLDTPWRRKLSFHVSSLKYFDERIKIPDSAS